MARRLCIVSGGQTGVDRAALDAAIAAGVPCRGWCPAGRKAEDGVIPARYPLHETASACTAERTRRNVEDSDGTLVLRFAEESPGSRLTEAHARRIGKPLLEVAVTHAPYDEVVDRIVEFVECLDLQTVNIAGPRASEAPGAYAKARQLIDGLIRAFGQAEG